MDAGARSVAHLREGQIPEGLFTVRLEGRVSLNPHEPMYPGDVPMIVLIEKVLDVEKPE
jgi:hypothetical protein